MANGLVNRIRLSEGRVIGNEALREQLAGEIRRGTMPHAYLLEGGRGMGKHLLAKEICAALSCQSSENGALPCRKCRNCQKILEDKSPDVRIIGKGERASIGVDDVRFLRSDVLIPPNDLEHRFYIIEDAQDMTEAAQNALLLTLEEPPSYVVFLLLTENTANMLETIRSRAPALRLCPVDDDTMETYLTTESKGYGAMPPAERVELLRMAAGSVGRALELMDGRARKPLIDRRRFVARVVEHCLRTGRRDTMQSVELIGGFGNAREEISAKLALMQQAVRDLIVLKKSDGAPLLFYADREEAAALSQSAPIAVLHQTLQKMEYTRGRILRNANVRLALTELLLCDDVPSAIIGERMDP